MSKATAIYVRVSHRDQTHASQLPDLERWDSAHDGSVLCPDDYIALLEQGSFDDVEQKNLVLAAAGRIHAAMHLNQLHFDDLEQSHQYLLAGVLAAILYHRGS